MLFAPKEKGQSLIEIAIYIAIIALCLLVIALLPDCGGDWKAAVRFIFKGFQGVCQ